MAEGMSFGKAFELVKQNGGTMHGMRLPQWEPDVIIKAWMPYRSDGTEDPREMTAPFLYVESRFGRVPWKETMIELFSEEWEVYSLTEGDYSPEHYKF